MAENGDDGWEDINGATSDKFRFVNSGYADTGEYRCRVNSIYEDDQTGDIYYITTYSDVFTVEYSMRKAQVASFVADRDSKTVSIKLKSAHENHFYAPTGKVVFRIEGRDFDKTYSASLKVNTADYTSTATLDLDSTGEDQFGANLLVGAYRISAFYTGGRVFQAFETDGYTYYVEGNKADYFVNLDKKIAGALLCICWN